MAAARRTAADARAARVITWIVGAELSPPPAALNTLPLADSPAKKTRGESLDSFTLSLSLVGAPHSARALCYAPLAP